MIVIDNKNYESVWSNATKEIAGNEISFTAKEGGGLAISFPITYQPDSHTNFIIVAKFVKDVFISFVDTANNETKRVNINPFWVGGRYIIPIEMLHLNHDISFKFARIHTLKFFAFKAIEFSGDQSVVYEYKIMLSSGIGDCLRTIARNTSIKSFSKNYSIHISWCYGGRGLHNSGWAPLLQDFVFRNDIFKYIDEASFESLNVPELFNGYSGDFLLSGYIDGETRGIDVPLKPQEFENVNLILQNSYIRIGVQLQGNDPKKNFGNVKYIALLKAVLATYPNATIFIIDAPNRHVSDDLLFDERVVSLVGKTNLSENISLIQKMDLWISPDSFSKYVASWSDVRQIVLCTELPYMSPSEMLMHAFVNSGLISNPRVKLVGIDYDPVSLEVSHIVGDVSEIDLDDVIRAL